VVLSQSMGKPTLSDYGKAVDLSHADSVKKHLERCFGSAQARPTVNKFVIAYIRSLREEAAGRSVRDDEELNPAQEKARKDKADADLKELQIAKLRGELVSAEEWDMEQAKVDMEIKSGFLALPSRMARELADESDPRKVQTALDKEVREVLSSLADGDDDFDGEAEE